MVGNEYIEKEKGERKLIEVGKKVKEGKKIIIIEEMKKMKKIKEKREGKVKDIMVEDDKKVELGEKIVVIE